MTECRYEIGVDYEIPPPTVRDAFRMLTVGYVCDCGCGTHWLPVGGRTVEGPPMLGCRDEWSPT